MTTTLTQPQKPAKILLNHLISPESLDEIVALCPKCKTFETLFFSEEGLLPTRRFIQEDGHVYHNCGCNEPCRLYRVC